MNTFNTSNNNRQEVKINRIKSNNFKRNNFNNNFKKEEVKTDIIEDSFRELFSEMKNKSQKSQEQENLVERKENSFKRFEKRTFNEEKAKVETEAKIERKVSNKRKFNIKNLSNGKDILVQIFRTIMNTFKAIFKFAKKRPILAGVIVFVMVLVANIGLIQQTILLKSIDSLQQEITVIQNQQTKTNNIAKAQINELEKQIAQIKQENAKYNEKVDLELRKKTELLKNRVNKLTALAIK